jgi:hypothetical protein
MRLHAEQECLDIALQQVRSRNIPRPDADDGEIVDDMNDYLNQATRLIQRSNWGGVSASAILEAYDAAERVTPADKRLSLAGEFDWARRKVAQKIQDYEARRSAVRLVSVTNVSEGATYVEKSIVTNVSGQQNVVTVAEYMNGVTTSVNQSLTQSKASADVQELVKTLTKQIGALSTQIPEDKSKQMAADVETLAKEIALPEPRRKWYEISMSGLKEAAEKIGEIGKPVIETVKLLWPLLLP